MLVPPLELLSAQAKAVSGFEVEMLAIQRDLKCPADQIAHFLGWPCQWFIQARMGRKSRVDDFKIISQIRRQEPFSQTHGPASDRPALIGANNVTFFTVDSPHLQKA